MGDKWQFGCAAPGSPFLITRANRELPLIRDVEKCYANQVAVIPQ